MGKILFESILSTSTSTQPKKYLKYKCKYTISKVFKIQVQNTAPEKVFKIQLSKYLLGAKSNCLDRLSVVTIKFCLTINFFNING